MIKVALSQARLRVDSRESMVASLSKLDPFQPKAGWHRPYYTRDEDLEIEASFRATFGGEP